MGGARGLVALLGLGMIAQVGVLGSTTLADSTAGHALQIYGLTLDDTRLGNGFCEKREAGDPVRRDCGTSEQALPEIVEIDVQTTPASHVRLALTPDSAGRKRDVRIWYEPRERGGRSFMITATIYREAGLESVRNEVLEAFGPPTIEFTHADMEARGIHVADLTVDTLIYVDRGLPDTQWARVAHRLRTEFRATGAELFSLTDTRLRTLARLLGADFRGAIVQISESGWTHHSTVSTILLDLKRAGSVFRLDG
jgi:hypothetical protein